MVAPSSLHSGAARVGDDQIKAWMVQYGGALRKFFARRVGPGEAEDLVQEVFLSLQRNSTETSVENVESFLFTVARRVLIARYRGAKSHRLLDFPEKLPDEADEISPERILAAKQEYARAMVAIMELPPRDQVIFVLHRFSKLSYSTIAKRMGISKRTVQGIMERAIARVAAHMRSNS